MPASARPTHVRYVVVLVTMLVSVLLYLDRFCLTFAETFIKEDLGLTRTQTGWLFGAFFLSYGLAQVPSGWLTDRWGGRLTLTLYVLAWSLFTGWTGLAIGFLSLFVLRLGVGVGQAGAYPTAANLVSKWVPFAERGAASSIVAMGGRIGGALAPVLTAYLITSFVPVSMSSDISAGDLMNATGLAVRLQTASSDGPTQADLAPAQRSKAAATARIGQRIAAGFSPAGRAALQRLHERHDQALAAKKAGPDAAGNRPPPSLSTEELESLLEPGDRDLLAQNLNQVVHAADFYQPGDFAEFDLPSEGKRYKATLKTGGALEPDQSARFNRLLLEAVYPAYLKKVYGAGWRPVMFLFGAVGLVVAAVYWLCLRNRPQDHPRCNDAERALIDSGRPPEIAQPSGQVGQVPLGPLVKNGNLWLANVSVFFTNIGWVFIVTWMLRYFEEVHHVPVEVRGWIGFIPIAVGAVGMYLGGRWTDVLVRRIGLRWGRALPIGVSRFLGMAAYLCCLTHPQSAWAAVAAFAAAAFFTDLGIGALWAYMQDIGGRYVGSVLGWNNMWGNFGAFVGPILIGKLLGDAVSDRPERWDAAIVVCALSFGISGLTGLLVDARRPVVAESPAPAAEAT